MLEKVRGLRIKLRKKYSVLLEAIDGLASEAMLVDGVT